MMKWIETIWYLLAAIILSGCASVEPGNDPLIVRSEQTAQIALSTFDALFNIEYSNREWIDAYAPMMRDRVNHLRDYAPVALKSLRTATAEYRSERSEVTASKLQAVLSSIASGLSEANQLITELSTMNHSAP